jgi:polyhydroxyalkanoate synthase
MHTPDPAAPQWLAQLFSPAAMLPGAWQTFSGQMVSLQQDYLRQLATFWPGTAGTALPADKRFEGEAWRNDPRFGLATQGYLHYSKLVRDAIESAALEPQTKRQWSFVARQLVDAMSPANFLASNPEALQIVLDTGGRSLVDGTTAGTVVFENELMQLIRYTPLTAQVYKRPLLVVPPCINKYYILDLQPENSLVRYALEQGQQVFLVSWRSATPAMDRLGWHDYLRSGVSQAITVTLELSGADQLNALGFCIGGTLLACAAALEQAQGQERLASLTLLTTMLDFVDTGELGLLVSEQSVAAREQAIGTRGVLQGSELALTFSSLRANDLIWPYVVNSYLKGKAPPAFDLLYWNSDATNLPGPMYCWYLRNTYLENRLIEPGGVTLDGVPLDLRRLRMPTYLYASRDDHIVPWQTAYASHRVLGGDTRFVLGASGHIAGVINPAAKNKRNHWVGGRPDGDAEGWLAGATSVPGSWWPDWSDWLAGHAGAKLAAPKTPVRGKYRAIEAAPGRYVKEKAQ